MSAAVSNSNGAAIAGEAEGWYTFNNQDGRDEEQQSLNHMRSGRSD